MPVLSVFYGIIVRMQNERGGRHKKPHIHALYAGKEIVLDLDGNILEGEFPNKQLKILVGWMAARRDDLLANWQLLSDGEPFFKIKPFV